METTDNSQLSDEATLALFKYADATQVEERKEALTALVSKKLLPKFADDPRTALGTGRNTAAALEATSSDKDRLLAIAEVVRFTQVVKKQQRDLLDKLAPAFMNRLPPVRVLREADDRLNLARACAKFQSSWLLDYAYIAVADEDTGEKARAEFLSITLNRAGSLEALFKGLQAAFEQTRPGTEMPAETVCRRLTRTMAALRPLILEGDLGAGDECGEAFYSLVAGSASVHGISTDEQLVSDLINEVCGALHDLLRTRMSVATDAGTYKVASYCKRLAGGKRWPRECELSVERLCRDVQEALLLLGKQGICDQALLDQLEVLSNHPDEARYTSRDLATKHPNLSEDVRFWLTKWKLPATGRGSTIALEASARSADGTIGLALNSARRARISSEVIKDNIVSALEGASPALASAAGDILRQVVSLTVQIEQVASLRGLELYGDLGQEVEFSPKFFEIVGDIPRTRMSVRQPAVVRKRPNGEVGEVVVKGLVE